MAVGVDEWDLAADAAARLVDHDKAYAGAKTAAETIAARQRSAISPSRVLSRGLPDQSR